MGMNDKPCTSPAIEAAKKANRRQWREPLLAERRVYPPHSEVWRQPRGTGPRPMDWFGIVKKED